ncbi:MAG: ATP-binding protein [Candidatus Pedobacter colombiensis]|uniref:ATP-binding protein n=1 Tax=Candidatus Pedobacter colombiensis TaxID=3121371 RepID=A0AAJ5WA93_9SPHI|nr:ATP-binding protein [Pedobacter sp.]WEK20203.1 MAG: ATP-binding protein [Pedobacter sp.]
MSEKKERLLTCPLPLGYSQQLLVTTRPFRAPHHSVSDMALVRNIPGSQWYFIVI